jgi:polyisoprenoid-binding protein YceI
MISHHETGRKSFLRQLALVTAVSICAPFFATAVHTQPASEVSAVRSEPALVRYGVDPSRSKFIAHALRGGLLWFKGHDHFIAARDFRGEAQLDPGNIGASSLRLVVKAASMVETSDVFTEQQKQIINKELREIVLEPEKYPEIVFKSTDVNGKTIGSGQYELKIGGNLTLHGVTKRIVIPTRVTITGKELRAIGKFSIDRGDFDVKATSAFHGLVRVRKKVEFEFDILGHEDLPY